MSLVSVGLAGSVVPSDQLCLVFIGGFSGYFIFKLPFKQVTFSQDDFSPTKRPLEFAIASKRRG